MSVPAEMGWQEAAAIPEVWLTAYQLLHLVGTYVYSDLAFFSLLLELFTSLLPKAFSVLSGAHHPF